MAVTLFLVYLWFRYGIKKHTAMKEVKVKIKKQK